MADYHRLVEDHPSGNDGVKYGTKADVEKLAVDFEKRQKMTSPATSLTVHEGVILEDVVNRMTIQDTRIGMRIYLRDRQWKETATLWQGLNSHVYGGVDRRDKTSGFAVKMEELAEFRSSEVIAWLQFKHHPNIPNLYGLVKEDYRVFLFGKKIDKGMRLDEYLETRFKELELSKMHSFIDVVKRQLSSAIEHIHLSGFSHNDVYGQNILVDKNRKVWLIDFGDALPWSRDINNEGQKMDWLCVEKVVEKVKLAFMKQKKKIQEENKIALLGTKNPPDQQAWHTSIDSLPGTSSVDESVESLLPEYGIPEALGNTPLVTAGASMEGSGSDDDYNEHYSMEGSGSDDDFNELLATLSLPKEVACQAVDPLEISITKNVDGMEREHNSEACALLGIKNPQNSVDALPGTSSVDESVESHPESTLPEAGASIERGTNNLQSPVQKNITTSLQAGSERPTTKDDGQESSETGFSDNCLVSDPGRCPVQRKITTSLQTGLQRPATKELLETKSSDD